MLNDTTILRLHYGTGEPELVAPSDLAGLTIALETFVEKFLHSVGVDEVKTYLVAAPRRGSLEFHLKVELKFRHESREIIQKLLPQTEGRLLSTLADISTIAALVWAIVFAPGGIAEQYSPFPKPVGIQQQELRQSATAAVVELNRGEPISLTEITTNAARTGALRVEIQVPDELPVILYDRNPQWIAFRPQFSKFSMWNATAEMHHKGDAHGDEEVSFTPIEHETYHVRLNSHDYQAFWMKCHTGLTALPSKEPLVLALWPIQLAVPNTGQVHHGLFLPASPRDIISIPDNIGLTIDQNTIVLIGNGLQ